ncbi:MAG: CPBP family intramembrane metalloprotease [Muribaculaceae bacterium]|nr:CPBP family intramembrane metalloprotease [Muribaculaceae bacterium]
MYQKTSSNQLFLSLTFGKRLGLFVCIFFVCYLISAVLGYLVMRIGHEGAASLRIATVVQDMLVFIVPAAATAVMITRRPDRFLLLERSPRWAVAVLALFTFMMSVPLMNRIVVWNEGLQLPDSMQSLQVWMAEAEQRAAHLTDMLIGGTSVSSMVMGVLIVGVLAGLSEELFFRGALQRLLMTRPMNAHVAIWLTAALFSLFHFQFFGFVPRMLLGALFGYMAWWTRCLWIPIMLHVVNNSLVVVTTWLTNTGRISDGIDTMGTTDSVTDIMQCVTCSVLFVVGLVAIRRLTKRMLAAGQTVCDGK